VTNRILVGTAGWSIPRDSAGHFPGEGTHLQRYARQLGMAEINSSFHRPHKATTYAKWTLSTPSSFQFAVKVPKTITHEQKLRRARAPLEAFLEETAGLGDKRGPLLIQLPPSLAFEARVAARFFDLLRSRHEGFAVCEPRHPSWFLPQAEALLVRYKVARAAADPALAPGAERPGGWPGLAYFRLHGSPRKYWSPYDDAYLAALAAVLRDLPSHVGAWCVFDNTASGAALANAWTLQRLLAPEAVR
jgi:uncharacterized protein YecE (DUF72 family)